jgi:hypothetical protein
MIARLALAALTLLAACDTVPLDRAEPATRGIIADSALPPMKVFSRPQPAQPAMSNGNIAADFLALHFALESGRELERFTRFETPITVQVTGRPPAHLNADLARLLGRLRSEAGIDIRQVGAGDANIVIHAVSRDEIRRTLPHAACFVVPNVSSLAEFRRDRRSARTNWAELDRRDRMAIFLPFDAAPQEVRDCLHEELAQAIGPLNDLYRLSQSVFNDDNVHTVLTGFDMLILRAGYAPDLQSGMSRREVAARLPQILSRINPGGDAIPGRPVAVTPRSWIEAIQTALGPGASATQRRAAVDVSLDISDRYGLADHRLAFSHYIAGRMMQAHDPAGAQGHFSVAERLYDTAPGTDLHRAYISAQVAAYHVSRGDGARALALLAPALPVAERAENAALLATLMLIQAEALSLTGQHDRARAVRLDSLGWARYGFGSDWAVRAKMREIALLSPLSRS